MLRSVSKIDHGPVNEGGCLRNFTGLFPSSSNRPINVDNLQHPDSSWRPVIFLCGQSNMEGIKPDNDVPEIALEQPKNIYVFYKD